MTYIVVLVALLIALAGVIAYTGDVLGTLVGKRRLSLFGARPKQSGRIIGVIAGILIMLVTLGTLALSFRNAVQVIMRAQPVAEQLAEQQARLRRSTAQVETLQQQVEARNNDLAQAQAEVATAEQARDEARAAVTDLKTTQAALQGNVDELNGQVAGLNDSLVSATAEVEAATADLTAAWQQLEGAEAARDQAVSEAAAANRAAAASQQEVETLNEDVAAAQQTLEGTQTQLADTKDALSSAKGELEQAANARDEALQRQAEAEAKADTLQANIDQLEVKAEELSTQNNQLSEQNAQLNAQNSDLEEASLELVGTNRELLDLNARLRDQTQALSQQLQDYQTINEALKRDVEQQAAALERAKEEADNFNSRNISYDVNQVVHSGVITAQEPTLIRVQLAQLVQAASENAVLRGGLDVTLTPEQTENIVQEAAQTPGEDVVVLRSKMNQYVSAPVEVAVEVAPNQKLLEDAQLVVSRQIFLRPGSRDQLRDDLVKVLADANAKLLGLGLSDEVYPSLSETSLEVDGFTNQLLRLKGPVTVGLQASAPIFAGGPAKLEFVIVN